jgi:hypothetical protein
MTAAGTRPLDCSTAESCPHHTSGRHVRRSNPGVFFAAIDAQLPYAARGKATVSQSG